MNKKLPRNRKDLISIYESSEIESKGVILLHSNTIRWFVSLSRGGESDPYGAIIDTLLDYMSKEGTVLFPLFNYIFCTNGYFDYQKTPSSMGALTERARQDLRFKRTAHPIYSFAVSGKYKNEFVELTNKGGYSKNSPFGLLNELGGQIAVLDLPDQNAMTFYHFIEEINQVPYRYNKDFKGVYVEENGRKENRTYSLYVRDLDAGVETWLYPCEELLWKKNIYKGDKQNLDSGLRSIKCSVMYEFVSSKINECPKNFLYRIKS